MNDSEIISFVENAYQSGYSKYFIYDSGEWFSHIKGGKDTGPRLALADFHRFSILYRKADNDLTIEHLQSILKDKEYWENFEYMADGKIPDVSLTNRIQLNLSELSWITKDLKELRRSKAALKINFEINSAIFYIGSNRNQGLIGWSSTGDGKEMNCKPFNIRSEVDTFCIYGYELVAPHIEFFQKTNNNVTLKYGEQKPYAMFNDVDTILLAPRQYQEENDIIKKRAFEMLEESDDVMEFEDDV